MKAVFVERLIAMAKQDPRVILITGDLGYNCFEPFSAACPKQFLNAGVAEQNMTTLAAGLALEGHIVYTYSIANFAFMRCLEQIRNDCAYHDCNVNVVAVGGGFSYGQLGISHHATEDLAIMRSLPNTVLAAPGDDWEAAELTSAVAEFPGVSYLRLDRSSAGNTRRPGESFVFGKARVVREGKDFTLASTGGILSEVLKAAKMLADEEISCRVLSVPTVKPLDVNSLVDAAEETGGIITVEEHTVDGGFGSAVAESLLELGSVPRIFHRIGLRAGFSSVVGDQQYLRGVYGIDADTIVSTVKARLGLRVERRAA